VADRSASGIGHNQNGHSVGSGVGCWKGVGAPGDMFALHQVGDASMIRACENGDDPWWGHYSQHAITPTVHLDPELVGGEVLNRNQNG